SQGECVALEQREGGAQTLGGGDTRVGGLDGLRRRGGLLGGLGVGGVGGLVRRGLLLDVARGGGLSVAVGLRLDGGEQLRGEPRDLGDSLLVLLRQHPASLGGSVGGLLLRRLGGLGGGRGG